MQTKPHNLPESPKKPTHATSKTVYVGDTPTTDIQGAHNTGIKAILIKRPPLFQDSTQQPQKQHPKPQPDHTIQSLTELPTLFKKPKQAPTSHNNHERNVYIS